MDTYTFTNTHVRTHAHTRTHARTPQTQTHTYIHTHIIIMQNVIQTFTLLTYLETTLVPRVSRYELVPQLGVTPPA